MRRILLFSILSIAIKYSECSKILAIFHINSPSHFFLGNAYLLGLANAGHDVTMVSPYANKISPRNGTYREIIIKEIGTGRESRKSLDTKLIKEQQNNKFAVMKLISNIIGLTDKTLSDPEMQKLLHSNETFDAIIIVPVYSGALFGLGPRFNAPIITFNTIGANPVMNFYTRIPLPLSYVPNPLLGLPVHMTFMQRVVNTISYLIFSCFNSYMMIQEKNMYQKYFPNAPPLEDVMYNVSFNFFNHHESIGQALPNVPNTLNVGGFHIKPPKKLPSDLQQFLDNAKDGAILFSLGSNAKSIDLPINVQMAIINPFAKLKHKVVWKWENDTMTNQPNNVKISKWLPQSDILGHPNLKLFVTHGGLLSTTEAVDRAVPILAIPHFADQELNAKRAEDDGYGLVLKLKDITEETFTNKLTEILTNQKYSENIKHRSKLLHDRPMKPMDSLVYWTEYVIRHKGAPHLRVAGLHLNWFQYMLIDVIAFLVISILIVIYISKKILQYLFSFCFKSKNKQIQKVKTN